MGIKAGHRTVGAVRGTARTWGGGGTQGLGTLTAALRRRSSSYCLKERGGACAQD
jgi:hypothetical protein